VWPSLLSTARCCHDGDRARSARGSDRSHPRRRPLHQRLWLLVVIVATAATVVLSLDTTAVLLTPVVVVMAAQLGLNRALFAYTAVWLANTASLLLPVSNLTNLLSTHVLAANALAFAHLMWPAALAAVLITVAALAVSSAGRCPAGMFGWRRP
jgi:Na+/H+ antiporter NhaD/arsenite permease-like protein